MIVVMKFRVTKRIAQEKSIQLRRKACPKSSQKIHDTIGKPQRAVDISDNIAQPLSTKHTRLQLTTETEISDIKEAGFNVSLTHTHKNGISSLILTFLTYRLLKNKRHVNEWNRGTETRPEPFFKTPDLVHFSS